MFAKQSDPFSLELEPIPYFAGIEAGGTKFVCGVGTGPGDLRSKEIPTTGPAETLDRALLAIRDLAQGQPLDALGIAAFGPIELSRSSGSYGHLLATPKPGWARTDLAGFFESNLSIPVALETDVNAAMLAEVRWGAAVGLTNALYLTVGTGIGGGALVEGRLLHGARHPEMGHMLVRHDKHRDPFEGVCPFHKDCLEGLASGPAIERRWGARGENLPVGHGAWELEASYLAQGLMNLMLTLSPERIVLGGGVLGQRQLYPLVRQQLMSLMNGYVELPDSSKTPETFVVPPLLGKRAGILGALAIASAS